MNSFPAELIYVLVFAAILLVQTLMKRFGPKLPHPQDEPAPELLRQEQTFQDEPDPELLRHEQTTLSPVSTASDMRFGRSASPSAVTMLPERRFSRGALMGNRRAVQNAVVIATILQPCRAYQPHDIR